MQWLDGACGEAVGAPWTGPTRHGAARDAASLAARAALVAAKRNGACTAAAATVTASTTAVESAVDGSSEAAMHAMKSGPGKAAGHTKQACDDQQKVAVATAAAKAAASAVALAQWRPNPHAPDADRWGGAYGKPCGHNEVCLLC